MTICSSFEICRSISTLTAMRNAKQSSIWWIWFATSDIVNKTNGHHLQGPTENTETQEEEKTDFNWHCCIVGYHEHCHVWIKGGWLILLKSRNRAQPREQNVMGWHRPKQERTSTWSAILTPTHTVPSWPFRRTVCQWFQNQTILFFQLAPSKIKPPQQCRKWCSHTVLSNILLQTQTGSSAPLLLLLSS